MIDGLLFAIPLVGERAAAATAPPEWQIYFVLAAWNLTLAVVVRIMPSYWREPNPHFARVPWFWVWGEALYRGSFVRAAPTITFVAIVADAIGIYLLVVGRENANAVVIWGWFALFMACLAVWGSVTLFNQPKWVVPPYMRDEPGAVSEWMRSRGAKRREVVLWLRVTVVWLVIMVLIFAGGARKVVEFVQSLPH